MGSDRRFLSGKALAKIYEEISTGPSFTPLRGPSNRIHTPLPRITQEQVDNAGYGTNAQTEVSQGPVEVPRKSTAQQKRTTKDNMSSSSARPPPPHPILKKSRGPSTSGPRPTARFVSPHDSEDDTAKDEDSSSGSVAARGMQMDRLATKSPVKGEKKSTPTGRKFTASSAAKRHSRPVLARRPSSQSSAVSDASTKSAASATGSRTGAGGRPASVEQPLMGSVASSSNSMREGSLGLSAKAAGKRPLRPSPDRNRHRDRESLSSAQGRTSPVIVHQQLGKSAGAMESSSDTVIGTPAQSLGVGQVKNQAKLETPEARTGADNPLSVTAPMMARSQSNIENQRHPVREATIGRPLPPSMITPKSTPVAKKAADVAVQVQFDSKNVTAQGGGGIARDLPDSVTIASRPSTSSLYTPTQPSPTPAPFLGRSKSQLTLLLEKMDQSQGKPKSNRDR